MVKKWIDKFWLKIGDHIFFSEDLTFQIPSANPEKVFKKDKDKLFVKPWVYPSPWPHSTNERVTSHELFMAVGYDWPGGSFIWSPYETLYP